MYSCILKLRANFLYLQVTVFEVHRQISEDISQRGVLFLIALHCELVYPHEILNKHCWYSF